MKYLYLFLLLAFAPVSLHSQTPDAGIKYWADGSLGLGFVRFSSSDAGLMGGYGGSMRIGSNIFSIKVHAVSDFALFTNPEEKEWNVIASYGKAFDVTNRAFITLTGGCGYTESSRRTRLIYLDFMNDSYESHTWKYFTVSMESELLIKFTNYMGTGLSAHVSATKQHVFYGFQALFILGCF